MRITLPDERRARLAALAQEHDASHAELSRIIGRGETYISRYLRRAVPYDLPELDRRRLARFFGVDEETLTRRAPPRPGPCRR
ncbi:MAG TPA: helix-turn-helix transcriptional regulator [Sphingomonas sp.]|nr:helix-turn-helix transcriptional regulator [Sphingomonas sp.]